MSFDALKERVLAINRLLDEAAAANRIPTQMRQNVMKISPDYYQNQSATEGERKAFQAVRSRFADEEGQRGEQERRAALEVIAEKIDSLRSDLPEIAAAARFDLLDTVRDFRHAASS